MLYFGIIILVVLTDISVGAPATSETNATDQETSTQLETIFVRTSILDDVFYDLVKGCNFTITYYDDLLFCHRKKQWIII